MGWLERNARKRVDLQRVLARAKSVITLASSYSGDGGRGPSIESREPLKCDDLLPPFAVQTCRQRGETSLAGEKRRQVGALQSTGVIARYARFTDYHNVIAERLRTLTPFVNELGGQDARSLWYVDTGPLLERDLAQRAGLGFVGKHTNLINRKLGNWIFLSEIITTLEIEPDAAEHNHCGKCTRCIAACPTNAITKPFNVDARRCISYLTIELKGSIPIELRPLIGNRIFGCDDCLAVCPWNRFAREGAMMKSAARPDLGAPDLIELLSLDDAAFKARFAGTPILRAKRRGLLRNVCVALGNVGDERAVPALEHALNDPEPLVREHAAWGIEQIRMRRERTETQTLLPSPLKA